MLHVMPRLLHGLEILPLNQKQLDILSRLHTKTLRNFQALPTRTATCAVFLLLGCPNRMSRSNFQCGLIHC
jgi:hypothetical protein